MARAKAKERKVCNIVPTFVRNLVTNTQSSGKGKKGKGKGNNNNAAQAGGAGDLINTLLSDLGLGGGQGQGQDQAAGGLNLADLGIGGLRKRNQ